MSRAASILSHRRYRPHHIVTLGLLFLFTLWVVIWIAGSLHINKRLDRWAQDTGTTALRFSEKYTDGSPWMIHVHLRDFSFHQAQGHSVDAQEAILYLPLWNWRKISFKLKGTIRAQINQQSFLLDAAKFGFTLPKDTPASHEDTGMKLWASVLGILPQNIQPPLLGERIEKITFDARVMGQAPNPSDLDSLVQWRDASGVMEVDSLKVSWGPLALSVKGTMALDSALQPEGAFAGRIDGLGEALTLCQASDCLEERQIRMIQASLSVLARPSGPTGNTAPIVPLSLQGGELFLGPVKIAAMPKLVW